MNRFVVEDEVVEVPDWVVDLESFRRWADDDAFPEKGRISYLRDAVWVGSPLFGQPPGGSQWLCAVGGSSWMGDEESPTTAE